MDGIYLKEIPVPKIPDEIKKQYVNVEKEIENIIKDGFVNEALTLNEALVIDLYIYKEFELIKNLDMHKAKSILKRFKEDWG
jgi:hypothetical protein